MSRKISKLMLFVFSFLFFFVPIFFWPTSFELFEFNKMVLVYTATIIISFLWALKMLTEKKFIFRRTIMDIPLTIFLGSQIISTILSVDPRTSLLGYYSRFNGGLFSTFSYLVLYWALVSNFSAKQIITPIKSLLVSGLLVSIYGILEHFGIDKNLWVQDVQNRVFSTLGQPNWLAAWLIVIIPFSWALALREKVNGNKKDFWFWMINSLIFFITLLFTKSRSGILGFAVVTAIFTLGVFVIKTKLKGTKKFLLPTIIIVNLIFVILGLTINTPWRPKFISNLFTNNQTQNTPAPAVIGPALEVGGTESGEIRKIVWRGAIDIWKHYPVFGSGVETFAFSYYNYRPKEHNMVSEWDFLYNKAHNEYLNYLATTGSVGTIAYLAIILTFLIWLTIKFFQNLNNSDNSNKLFLLLALGSGYIGILVTNFFGFSVVPVSLLFFLIPGIGIVLISDKEVSQLSDKKSFFKNELLVVGALTLIAFFGLRAIVKYWRADNFYAQGRNLNRVSQDLVGAQEALIKAAQLSPKEAIIRSELSENSVDIALALAEQENEEQAKDFIQKATNESDLAISLSPNNLGVLRQRAATFIKLSQYTPQAILVARQTLIKTSELAPTDAKIIYNLGLVFIRTSEPDRALEMFQKAVELKPNYREARIALGATYSQMDQKEKAIEQYEYILQNIYPQDSIVQAELDKLK